jgi:hypothetical protein
MVTYIEYNDIGENINRELKSVNLLNHTMFRENSV